MQTLTNGKFILLWALLVANLLIAQEKTTPKDSLKKATKELPLEPERAISFSTNKGTWISLNVSPDGKTIAFDLLGDLYTLPITGGKANRSTNGMPYDVHPRYSSDGNARIHFR